MGFIEDFNNWANPINKGVNGFFNDIGNSFGAQNGNYPSHGYDPNVPSSVGGTADTGPSMSPTASNSPVSPSGDFSGGVSGSFTPAPSNGPETPSLNSSVINAVMNGISTPAINPALMENAFSGLKAVQPPDYLALTQNAFQHMQDQVKTMQDAIHGGYDQAKMDIGDIYNSNRNAATMGGNNILQQVAQNEGNAIQGSAQGNMNALANLKNSELAQRAAVAAKGGMPQAAGDNQSNPADVAAAGVLANAQAQAAHAQSAAGDRVNSNNLMADAMGNQNALMQNQLNNNRLSYDSSVGKYMTDLTNQEAQREMDASKQNYADQMQLRSLMYNMNKDAADMNIKKIAAIVGSRGLPAMLQDIGIANMDNAKAAATQGAAGNVDPARTALSAYPQFAGAYNNALANGMGLVAGTKPTYADVYKAMINDPSVSGNGNDLVNFAQMVTSPKALSDGSDNIYQLMSQFQGQ